MSVDEDAERHLVAVRRSYQEKLPSELTKLEKVLEMVRLEPNDLDSARLAHRMAHTLHGTAGTLGFAEISMSAGHIEDALKRLISGSVLGPSEWSAIDDFLARAQTAPERPSLMFDTASLGPRVASVATVLVVDDDPEMLAAIDLIARKNLIHIVPCGTCQDALAFAREKRFDGAILDLNLGGGENAFDIAQKLRSLEGLSDLPVAFMSADSSIPNRVAAAHAGASQFLQKPLSADEFVDVVRYFTTVKASASFKVLVVDDDPHFRAHIVAILKSQGIEVVELGKPERILEIVDTTKPDILLLDVNMPTVSGFDVCRMLRSTSSWKDLPILFLTAETKAAARLECFRAGGDDYIEKPVIKEELLARIGVRIERIRLYKERADRDGLTNLPNRRAFLEMFKLRIAEGYRFGRPVSLCIIDLDHFKNINDTYGHLAGDRVLVGLGKLLSSRFRTVDVRGRWGGEEFVVAFYGEESETAQMILGRVLEEFCQIEFEGDHGERFKVTFSGGVAAFPQHGTAFDSLFRAADERLYAAKQSGRNRIDI